MRTKEEILEGMETYSVARLKDPMEDGDNVHGEVLFAEILLDIRDILAEAYTEKVVSKLDEGVGFEEKDRTAEEWLNLFSIPLDSIIDPDGRDRKNYEESWNEKISLLEMNRRVSASTVYLDRFKDTPLSYKNHIELEEEQK